MGRKYIWILFIGAIAITLGIKAFTLGWFSPREPLELGKRPALLFFNKARGCECELYVYNNANAQINEWDAPVNVIGIDLDRRFDLAQQYQVIRAPTLILLNAEGQVVWKQDVGLSDEAPLDLVQVEYWVENLEK
jgi:hypothetical protein